MLEGVTCLPGIDTLLLLLLADLGDARQVAAFAAIPNQVDVAAVAPRLQVGGSAVGGQGMQYLAPPEIMGLSCSFDCVVLPSSPASCLAPALLP